VKISQRAMAIKWRLAVLMADREVDYKRLAEITGMHPVTVSKHKNSKVMPSRLESETLEKYCEALKCQPGELLVWMPELKKVAEEQTSVA
jgi:putative transcriptional regulator